jgi:hypothetical protein
MDRRPLLTTDCTNFLVEPPLVFSVSSAEKRKYKYLSPLLSAYKCILYARTLAPLLSDTTHGETQGDANKTQHGFE